MHRSLVARLPTKLLPSSSLPHTPLTHHCTSRKHIQRHPESRRNHPTIWLIQPPINRIERADPQTGSDRRTPPAAGCRIFSSASRNVAMARVFVKTRKVATRTGSLFACWAWSLGPFICMCKAAQCFSQRPGSGSFKRRVVQSDRPATAGQSASLLRTAIPPVNDSSNCLHNPLRAPGTSR